LIGTNILKPNDWVDKAHNTVSVVESIMQKVNNMNMSPSQLVVNIDKMSHELCLIGDAAELCRNVNPDPKMVCHAEFENYTSLTH
jgi:hypothetical protein